METRAPKAVFLSYASQDADAARREGYFNVLGYDYDVAPDEQRFLMLRSEHPETPITQLHAIVHWTEGLKRRVPAPEGQGR